MGLWKFRRSAGRASNRPLPCIAEERSPWDERIGVRQCIRPAEAPRNRALPPGGCKAGYSPIAFRRKPRAYFFSYVTRQIEFEPSSVTISEPSGATATPTGRPQQSPDGVRNPVRK